MTKKVLVVVGLVAIAIFGIVAMKYINKDISAKNMESTLKITSVFFDKEEIPTRYTCDGDNTSPEIFISGVSEKAKSLVLIVDDPDAPMGIFTHWLLYNIPADTTKISSQELPKEALQGINDFAKVNYGGPCLPSGVHRYFFKLYSIDKILNLDAGATKPELQKAIRHHILQKAELIGLYSRENDS